MKIFTMKKLILGIIMLLFLVVPFMAMAISITYDFGTLYEWTEGLDGEFLVEWPNPPEAAFTADVALFDGTDYVVACRTDEISSMFYIGISEQTEEFPQFEIFP